MNAFHIVVEDEQDGASQFSVYNYKNILNPQKFKKGTKFKLYEPYYKIANSGEKILRVDDPFMIEFVQSENVDPYSNLSSEELKLKGNEELQKKNYDLAYEIYTQAIKKDTIGNAILFSNRALASMNMEDYETAMDDIETAIKIDSGKENKNPKFYWRKSQCLMELEEFQQASEVIETFLKENKNLDKNLINEFEIQLMKIKMLINNTKGVFNEEVIIYKHLSGGHLNIGNFINPKIEIKMTNAKGRGLFAQDDIFPGEILLFEKAVVYDYNDENSIKKVWEFNFEKNRVHFNQEVKNKLFSKVQKNKLINLRVEHLLHNSKIKENFKYCDINVFKSGAYSHYQLNNKSSQKSKISMSDIDEMDSVNAFSDDVNLKKLFKQEKYLRMGHGIWLVCSLMNHSCYANTDRLFLDEYMVVQSSRLIKKGEEIFTHYCPILDFEERKKILQNYNFTCKCEICEYESKNNCVKNINDKTKNILENLNQGEYSKSIKQVIEFKNYLNSLDSKYLLINFESLSNINKMFLILVENSNEVTLKTKFTPKEIISIRVEIDKVLIKLEQTDTVYINFLKDLGSFIDHYDNDVISSYTKKMESYNKNNSKLFLKWYGELYKLFTMHNPVNYFF